MTNLRRLVVAIFAILFLTAAAFADPPSRVVRLDYMNGQVSIQPGGVEDWVPATINRPLTGGDNVWTDKSSRAELHLGTGAMRMDGETSVTISNVGDNTVQVDLHQGTLNLRVAQLYDGEIYEVDTPNLAFTVLKSGDYRFDVDPNGDTTLVTVRKGEGEATGDGPGVRVSSGRQAQFSDGKSLNHNFAGAPNRDGFDDWCRVRNEREDRSVAVRYVPRGVIGYEDLDEYGNWVEAHPYGHVWVPTHVVVGWAPYRYGHWIWVSPWGWTWVDDAPWGFAPFHYGRWVHYRAGWAWCPGPINVRPYYAPALVAWVGGSNWGVGLSFGAGGGVGWFPLGYGEPYIPNYQHSRGYFQSVNVSNTHITNITYVTNNYYNNTRNITRIKYVNERVDGAVTAVPRHTLENSRPVDRDLVRIDKNHLRNASVIHEPDVRPSRNSALGVHGGSRGAVPPPHAFDRPVVSKLPHPAGPERRDARRDDRRDDRGQGRGEDLRQDHRAGGPPEGRPGDRGNHLGQGQQSDRDKANHEPPEGRPGDRGNHLGQGQQADRDNANHQPPEGRPGDRGNHLGQGQQSGRDNANHEPSEARPGDRGNHLGQGQQADRDNANEPPEGRPGDRGNHLGQGQQRPGQPDSGPNAGERATDRERGRGVNDEHGNVSADPRSGQNVPRPPENNRGTREADNRNHPANSAPNAAEGSHAPRGNSSMNRPVPRPPDRVAGAGEAGPHNSPAAAAGNTANGTGAARGNASSEKVVSRPHDTNTRWTRPDVRSAPASASSNAADAARPSRDNAARTSPRTSGDQQASRPVSQSQQRERPVSQVQSTGNGRVGNTADNSRGQSRAPEMQGRQSLARDSQPKASRSSNSGGQASRPAEQRRSEAADRRGKSKDDK